MPIPEDPRPGWRALGQPDEFSPLGAESGPAGSLVRPWGVPRLLVRVLGPFDATPWHYAWEEVYRPAADQDVLPVGQGRDSSHLNIPAAEVNRSPAVPVGFVAYARMHESGRYLEFEAAPQSAIWALLTNAGSGGPLSGIAYSWVKLADGLSPARHLHDRRRRPLRRPGLLAGLLLEEHPAPGLAALRAVRLGLGQRGRHAGPRPRRPALRRLLGVRVRLRLRRRLAGVLVARRGGRELRPGRLVRRPVTHHLYIPREVT
jgi:hypothetical protein